MPFVSSPMLFGSNNIIEQLSKALRAGELGNEASLQVHVRSCKNLPRHSCYLSVSTKHSREIQKSQTHTNTSSPSFDETFSIALQNRSTDVLVIKVFEVGPQDVQDEAQLLGKVELRVSDFGKLNKEVWGGSTSGWFDLLDGSGNLLCASPGDSRNKSQIDLTVQFVESPKNKVVHLEKQLENLQNLYDIAKERIDSRESEIRRLNEDLTRKTEDLVEVRSERDDARDQLKKIRMNVGIAPTQVSLQPTRSIPTPQKISKEAPSLQTAELVSQESHEVVQKLNQEIGNLNAYLIQTLDDLGNREDELAKSKEEMKRNREDLDVIKTQQLLIYKEYAQKVGGLESEIEVLKKKLASEKDKSDQESKKAFSALRKFQDLSENLHPDDLKRKLIESERNLIMIQADQDTADRVAKLKSEEARQLRNRYDELVIEMSRQEQRLKHRIGILERTARADERRLNEFQRRITETVSKEEWNKLKYDHIILQEKHKAILSRESKSLLERASVEAFRKRAERTEHEMAEMKIKLSEASEKAISLESRLEQLAAGDSDQNQQQLAALSQKVIKLEVSERNAVRRAELALERMQSMEKDNLRIQERIAALEDESIENASRIHELEETENELRQRMEGSISADQAKEWKAKMQAQEGEISELHIKISQLQEIADLATDQANAMEELHMAHAEELDALRQCLSKLHAESDESAETGALQRQVMDRERQIHEMKSKLSNLDKELARMDDYAIRLEELLENKSNQVFSVSDEAHNAIRALERQVEEQRARLAGSISLDQADQWAQSLRDLTDQKQKALEDLTDAKKKIEDAEHKAASLEIQLGDQKAYAKQVMDQLREGGTSSGGSQSQSVLQRLSQQTEELTSYKLENLRLSRQLRQMQERENHLEHLCQQNEKEVRKLEEQVIMLEAERDGIETKKASEVETLKAKIKDLENAAREVVIPGKRSMMSSMISHARENAVPSELTAAEARSMDHEAIMAMRHELITLTKKLQEKEEEVEHLKKEPKEGPLRGEGEQRSKFDVGDSQAGLTEAAQHTQEVASLAIERLEKDNRRKTDKITQYQEQLRQAREEYMNQKELDTMTIQELREKLAAKTIEAISNLRSRTAGHGNVNLSSADSADAEAIFAEKDQTISALHSELQSLNRKNEQLSREKEKLEESLRTREEEIKIKDEEIKKSEGRKPSQVLETLVLKLKHQLAEKEQKQQELQKSIKEFKNDMSKASEAEAVAQSAELKEQVDALVSRLASLKSKLSEVKRQLEEEQMKSSNLETKNSKLIKENEILESTIRRQAVDLKKAERLQREAQDAFKKLEKSIQEDKQQRETQDAFKKPEKSIEQDASRFLERTEPARGGTDKERENAIRRWEAEKRLEAKVEKLSNQLRTARKDMENLEKDHLAEKEKIEKDAERLRQRVEILEDDKKQLKARLRGAGQPVDSDEVLARVREAERKVMELEERNDQLLKELNIEGKIKVEQQRQTMNLLEKQVKELQETKESQAQQLRAIDDENSYMREKSREMKRLEGSITELRTRNETLENELLAAQNELVRLRFETEHSDLRLERWKRRVRELEALPLAIGKAEGLAFKPGKKKTKEEEEMERFVRSTKVAMEKLHRQNESLKANSATNVKYMDSVREAKSLKLAIAERDKEITTLNEKLLSMKDQVEKKAKLDEKVRSLERQLKAEQDTSKDLQDRLTEKSRRVNRLESDLASARESAGGDGDLSDRVREAIEEAEALRSKLRSAEREKVALEKERDDSKRDLRLAEKRAEECMQRLEEEMRRIPKAAGHLSSHDDQEEIKKLRDKIRDLETENQDLKGELNCFDPAFFDEIEDLKYNHNEMTKLVDRYEALLMQLSSRYGFEFTPQVSSLDLCRMFSSYCPVLPDRRQASKQGLDLAAKKILCR
uniref:C2 domain-containing protein n=1 Tax=Hanusia phi TaxID=3032 RepID=A0A7S0I2Y2_9CRYP